MSQWKTSNPPGDGSVVWGFYPDHHPDYREIRVRKLDGIWTDFEFFSEVSAPTMWRTYE